MVQSMNQSIEERSLMSRQLKREIGARSERRSYFSRAINALRITRPVLVVILQ